MDEITDNYIIEKLDNLTKIHRVNNWKLFVHRMFSQKEHDYIIKRYDYYDSYQEIFYRIRNNIEIRPVCKTCGKRVLFLGNHFQVYCSNKCRANDIDYKEKLKKSLLDKYGVDNIQKLESTKLKTQKTNTDRYGVRFQAQRKEVIEKYKKTNLYKYGVEFPLQLENNKRKCVAAAHTKEALCKGNQTCVQRYGTKYPFKQQWVIDKLKSQEVIDKRNATHKKNNSFNTSKPEERCYKKLMLVFKEVFRQYKSKEYPFNCDFYIPSIDAYIEYQGTWTHGGHPFGTQCNDESILTILKEKSKIKSKYYNNAIKTWAIDDVKKRSIAKENNLNYLEFFNEEQFDKWLNEYSNLN